jgi:hypothetical protein
MVRRNRSIFPFVCGRYGPVFFAVIPSAPQASIQAWDLYVEPLSESIRSTVTPRSANHSNSPMEDTDRGARLLIGVDFCISDVGMVVDDVVRERLAQQWIPAERAWHVWCCGAVAVPLLLPHESPAAVGILPNFVTFTWIIGPGVSCS